MTRLAAWWGSALLTAATACGAAASDGPDGGSAGPVADGGAQADSRSPAPGEDASNPPRAGLDAAADAEAGEAECGDLGPLPADAPGCAGTKLFARPSDPGAPGPWAVGAHTSTIAGLTTEIWYPAAWGSQSCKAQVTYDLREHLPTADQGKIPDSANPLQICDCYRDLPIDEAHGPYPVITFIHGTAAFRTQSLTFMTHWASRGFIVVSSDHPGIQLKDVLTSIGNIATANEAGDALDVLDAIETPTGDLAFLSGHLDMTRMAASGHSAGGTAVGGLASQHAGLQVIIPMAAAGVTAGGDLASSLVMSAADDGIATPSGQTSGYSSTPVPKRFVQIANAGHLVFSDLCAIGADQGGLLAIAVKYNVTNASLLAPLASDGCSWQTGKSYTPITPPQGWAVVDFATSAVLEATLMCDATMPAQIHGITQAVPNVASYQEQLQ